MFTRTTFHENNLSQVEKSAKLFLALDKYEGFHLVCTQCFLKKLTFLTRTRAYQGVRNVSFLGNFAYVLNGWSFRRSAQEFSYKFYVSIFCNKLENYMGRGELLMPP